MKQITTISMLAAVSLILLSCGTEPSTNPGTINLENVDNEPYVHIQPPEEPEGTPRETIIDWNEHGGNVMDFTKRIEYDNITITRRVTNIRYYSYWWVRNRLRAYDEKRTFQPADVEKTIKVDYCYYYGGVLENYAAWIDGSVYYFSEEFNPDTIDYSSPG